MRPTPSPPSISNVGQRFVDPNPRVPLALRSPKRLHFVLRRPPPREPLHLSLVRVRTTNPQHVHFHGNRTMKFFFEHLKNLRALYLNQLQMLLSAEEQIAIASLDMIEQSTNQELKGALEMHKGEADLQIARLKQILTAANGSATLVKCKAIHALIAETEDMLLDARNDAVRDVALIAAAQRS